MKFKLPSNNKPIYEVPVNIPIPGMFKDEVDYIPMYVTATMSSFNFKTNKFTDIKFNDKPTNVENSNRFNALPEVDKLFLQNVARKTIEHLVPQF